MEQHWNSFQTVIFKIQVSKSNHRVLTTVFWLSFQNENENVTLICNYYKEVILNSKAQLSPSPVLNSNQTSAQEISTSRKV